MRERYVNVFFWSMTLGRVLRDFKCPGLSTGKNIVSGILIKTFNAVLCSVVAMGISRLFCGITLAANIALTLD